MVSSGDGPDPDVSVLECKVLLLEPQRVCGSGDRPRDVELLSVPDQCQVDVAAEVVQRFRFTAINVGDGVTLSGLDGFCCGSHFHSIDVLSDVAGQSG